MHSDLNAQLAFHLTGMRSAGAAEALDARALRPALFAGYQDLASLRYDFPLVFGPESIESLSALVDRATEKAGDETRLAALRREREIRKALAQGASGRLSELWNVPAPLPLDGELADCDGALAVRFATHAWGCVHDAKARRFSEEAARLAFQLAGILAADFVQSDEGRSAEKLAASLAAADIDPAAMAKLLAKALPERRLPENRRRRIRSLLAVLKEQRFFASPDTPTQTEPHCFVFDSCTAALKAWRARRGELGELAKAMAAARLEAAGQYVESRHDPFFAQFAEAALGPGLAPGYLVRINARELQAQENASLPELLASGLPMKILVQHDDILERSAVANEAAFGSHARQLAGLALGLNDVFVVQSSASNLYRLRERVRKAMEYPGAALLNVFSGGAGHADGIPAYLVAAAAMESRAFPAFSYDPTLERPERFSLENNPQSERDWAMHALAYEDADHQRVREEVAFTLVDFAACDRRYAGFFARVPDGKANGEVPSLLALDGEDRLQKVIVAEPLVREAGRCLDAWRGLQALAKRPQPAPQPVPSEEKRETVKPTPAAAAPASAPAAAEPEKPASDAAYIDTPRCTTCEECVKVNPKLFVYDENKQAHITDPKLGTYRDLVEAAENCQVSIIHPGKPLNAAEPGLDELLKRAEPFL